MAVQTRGQLEAKAATISSETTAGANTAARVGGLFDDLADSVTLNGERGALQLYLDTDTTFAPTLNTAVVVVFQGNDQGAIPNSQFDYGSDYEIIYTGTSARNIRISATLSFQGGNNKRYRWYIGKNLSIIPQTLADITIGHNAPHALHMETVLSAIFEDHFTIYLNANDAGQITINSLVFNAFTI